MYTVEPVNYAATQGTVFNCPGSQVHGPNCQTGICTCRPIHVHLHHVPRRMQRNANPNMNCTNQVDQSAANLVFSMPKSLSISR